jgi:hypothetical protein
MAAIGSMNDLRMFLSSDRIDYGCGNRIDNPDLCTLFHPPICDRSRLTRKLEIKHAYNYDRDETGRNAVPNVAKADPTKVVLRPHLGLIS